MIILYYIGVVIGLIFTITTGFGLMYPKLFHIDDPYSKKIITNVCVTSIIITSISFLALVYEFYKE